ncbi:hypothetical protein V6N12_012519 [Hibiscus sabdariffa]|uniref:Uncharacterized protein n=1 Tax=Hibiscus sabdariffa TaxID=183260 RepID=A0ABR2B5D3_9ROSI
MASETPAISIKLLIDQDSNAVLLAEAGNDFVDTLHSLLKLPLGSIARLVDQHQSLQPGPRGHFICGNRYCNEKEGGWFSYYNTPICTCGKLMNVPATKLRESKAVNDVLIYFHLILCNFSDELVANSSIVIVRCMPGFVAGTI